MKAEGRRQKAREGVGCRVLGAGKDIFLTNTQHPAPGTLLTAFCLLLSAFCLPPSASAQKKPKPALKESEARRVIAATPGFELRTGAVRVVEVSAAGVAPATVKAEVTIGFRLIWVEDKDVPQTSSVFRRKRWRAVEFRTADRSWEEFDSLEAPLGPARVEGARRALEELVTEFEARERERRSAEGGSAEDESAAGKGAEGEGEKELTRGPLRLKSLSAMGSSAVAEVAVAATFRLARDARGKWLVADFSVGDEASGDLAALVESVNARKAERARAEMYELRAALEAFRGERGFYVVSDSEVVLLDHLSPRYITRVIRIDPWHRPYRYAGTRERFTLSSDGADGKQGTADDVMLSSGVGR